MAWTHGTASLRGERRGPGWGNRDYASALAKQDRFLFAVSNGFDRAREGAVGAELAASAFFVGWIGSQDPVRILEYVRREVDSEARHNEIPSTDYATSLVAGSLDPSGGVLLAVGGGGVVVVDGDGARLVLGGDAPPGDTASVTQADAGSHLKSVRLDAPVQAVFAFSDGLNKVLLDGEACVPRAPFLEALLGRLAGGPGRDAEFEEWLLMILGSQPVAERTDDDRTLIAAVWRGPEAG